jgi:hypothetical protein
MRTHELAKALGQLSKALRSLPDMEIEALTSMSSPGQILSNDSIAIGLATLADLSSIDKRQWRDFIQENNLPIEVKSSYSSRDILGKLLNYLQNDKDARNKLVHSTRNEKSSTSPELQRALQVLLRT